jgi:hypothetical protein
MPETIFRDGRDNAQRIHDKLNQSTAAQGKKPQERIPGQETHTNPTRTVHQVHEGGSQCKHGGY